MFKKIDKETSFGALFGIVAIIATIGEMIANGISTATVWGAIKDIAGTFVVIMLFLFAVKKIFENSEKNLSNRLENSLKLFEDNYTPLIFKVSNFKKMQNENYEQGFCILKDFTKFISLDNLTDEVKEKYSLRDSHETAKFIDLPNTKTMLSENFKVCFRTLQTCKYDDDFLEKVSRKIDFKYKEKKYQTISKSNCLIVEIPKIESKESIDDIISLFELVLICFEIGNKGVL